jgi:hypothetical protein
LNCLELPKRSNPAPPSPEIGVLLLKHPCRFLTRPLSRPIDRSPICA